MNTTIARLRAQGLSYEKIGVKIKWHPFKVWAIHTGYKHVYQPRPPRIYICKKCKREKQYTLTGSVPTFCKLCKLRNKQEAVRRFLTWKKKRYAAKIRKLGLRDDGGRDWLRLKVRIRDNFTCKDCGAARTPKQVVNRNKKCSGLKGRIKLFDVHHINGMCGKKSRGYDRLEDIDGLITLCHSCHYKRHDFSKRLEGAWK